MKTLSAELISLIHDDVIESHELQGLAADKSIEAVAARIDNRIRFGLINDVYDLAAAYAVCIAIGHIFNDANKRTAFTAMLICLELSGIEQIFKTEEIGQIIIKVAQGLIDEFELAEFLRQREDLS